MARSPIEGALTPKQMAYCEELLLNGYNATRAYMKAFPDCLDPDVACKQACKLNKKEEILNYIKQLQQENVRRFGDIAEGILKELAEDAFKLDDLGNKSPTWQKSVDLLQKQLGLQSSRFDINAKQNIVINIVGDDDEGKND